MLNEKDYWAQLAKSLMESYEETVFRNLCEDHSEIEADRIASEEVREAGSLSIEEYENILMSDFAAAYAAYVYRKENRYA